MPTLTATSTATRSVVAVYHTHAEAEDSVRLLTRAGVPARRISIVGKDWQAREDVQGYYQPADAIKEGAGTGAWVGGLFGMLMGFGLFILPVGGALIVLGPLAGLIAGAVGGGGVGALVGALVSLGIPKEQALKYQVRLEAGEFLVIVHGTVDEIEKAHQVLYNSSHIDLEVHEPVSA
ncbi:MAG: general stress protein [Capsulimonadaceae bacterium]